jgi:DNA-binding MarR family transcriptional regulator
MPYDVDTSECQACLCVAARRASRAITRLFDREYRPHGIRATQFTVLSVLNRGGPLTIGALAKEIGVERTTLTRNLVRLTAQGWVKIEGSEEDARSRIVSVTRKGRAKLAVALPAWRKAQSAAIAAIGDTGAVALRDLSGKSIG